MRAALAVVTASALLAWPGLAAHVQASTQAQGQALGQAEGQVKAQAQAQAQHIAQAPPAGRSVPPLVVQQLPPPAPTVPAAPVSRYIGRPIFSEPATGLQLPPGCTVDASSRARMGGTEHEVWVAVCEAVPRAWLLRRQVVERLAGNQARQRFLVIDERIFADEIPGDSLSVQCNGTQGGETGFVVYGARWRAIGKELRMTAAVGLLRADIAQQRFVESPLAAAACSRFPEREALMRQLQQPPAPLPVQPMLPTQPAPKPLTIPPSQPAR